MAETKSDAGQPQELQINPLNQRVLSKLSSFSRVTIDNMHLFLDSRQYPPNVTSLMDKWGRVSTISTNVTYPYHLGLDAEIRNKKITREQYDTNTATLDQVKKGLDVAVNERMPLVGALVENLIPSTEEMRPTEGGGFVYPKDKIDEIFTQEIAKRSVRIIDFLLDTDVVRWCVVVKKDEFQKFLSRVKEGNLPNCLVSEEEMVRLWDLHRENFAYEWHRMTDLYKASHPESAANFEVSSPPEAKSQGTETNAARYTFLDLYQKHGHLDTALKELADLYPNEKTQ